MDEDVCMSAARVVAEGVTFKEYMEARGAEDVRWESPKLSTLEEKHFIKTLLSSLGDQHPPQPPLFYPPSLGFSPSYH